MYDSSYELTFQSLIICNYLLIRFCAAQSIMGRDFATSELHHIKGLYKTWSGALTAYPFWDLGRFSAFGRAMIARGKFMELFQAKIHAMRQRQEAGEKLHGILGNMVAAVDENGSR